MMIAPKGHSAPQVPHPAQAAALITAGVFDSVHGDGVVGAYLSAFAAGRAMFSNNLGNDGSELISPLCISRMARAAAADAWVTLSLMSLGPSAQPA